MFVPKTPIFQGKSTPWTLHFETHVAHIHQKKVESPRGGELARNPTIWCDECMSPPGVTTNWVILKLLKVQIILKNNPSFITSAVLITLVWVRVLKHIKSEISSIQMITTFTHEYFTLGNYILCFAPDKNKMKQTAYT